MRSPMKFLERFDRLLILLMLTGIGSFFVGNALNALVLFANNGSMPMNAEPDVFYGQNDVPRHFASEGTANLLFLSDTIRINTPEVNTPEGRFWDGFREVARLVDFPLDGGTSYVSIGDILRWVGVMIFLSTLPPLLLRIPFRLAREGIYYMRKKPTGKGNDRT